MYKIIASNTEKWRPGCFNCLTGYKAVPSEEAKSTTTSFREMELGTSRAKRPRSNVEYLPLTADETIPISSPPQQSLVEKILSDEINPSIQDALTRLSTAEKKQVSLVVKEGQSWGGAVKDYDPAMMKEWLDNMAHSFGQNTIGMVAFQGSDDTHKMVIIIKPDSKDKNSPSLFYSREISRITVEQLADTLWNLTFGPGWIDNKLIEQAVDYGLSAANACMIKDHISDGKQVIERSLFVDGNGVVREFTMGSRDLSTSDLILDATMRGTYLSIHRQNYISTHYTVEPDGRVKTPRGEGSISISGTTILKSVSDTPEWSQAWSMDYKGKFSNEPRVARVQTEAANAQSFPLPKVRVRKTPVSSQAPTPPSLYENRMSISQGQLINTFRDPGLNITGQFEALMIEREDGSKRIVHAFVKGKVEITNDPFKGTLVFGTQSKQALTEKRQILIQIKQERGAPILVGIPEFATLIRPDGVHLSGKWTYSEDIGLVLEKGAIHDPRSPEESTFFDTTK